MVDRRRVCRGMLVGIPGPCLLHVRGRLCHDLLLVKISFPQRVAFAAFAPRPYAVVEQTPKSPDIPRLERKRTSLDGLTAWSSLRGALPLRRHQPGECRQEVHLADAERRTQRIDTSGATSRSPARSE